MPRTSISSRNGTTRPSPRWRYATGVLLAFARSLPAQARATRFRDPRHAHLPLPPFPAFEAQPAEAEVKVEVKSGARETTAETTVRPAFADVGAGRHVRIAIDRGTSLYGTGEQAGPLLRNGTRKTCWNSDAFGYDDRTRSLYQSHPWVLAVRPDGSAFGALCETTWRCVIDCAQTDPGAIIFEADGPSPAVTIVEGPDAASVVSALAMMTGTMPMPPRWALGYQQSRWSYEPQQRVTELAREFRTRRMPCDVIWLDIDYMDRFRCFTFDSEKFPDPAGLNAELHSLGFKAVWMIDPGLAVDPEYAVYKRGHDAGYFVRTARTETSPTSVLNDETARRWGLSTQPTRNTAGSEFQGRVWPGPCAFPDFTRASVRSWWADLYRDYMATGIDGVWNDMNEPAVFDGPGKTIPEHCVHDADADLGGPGPHAKYHNIYGMQMVRATREGIAAANPSKRPFVLTRASFLGGQRYAATWTGDNSGTLGHLRWSVTMVLNLGLSAQPFSGPDIGGFAGDVDGPTFARWMGIGAMLPFARAHKVKDAVPHEPWSFGPEVEESCRRALVRRYRLLPYLYTLFDEASRTGMPICRPVWFADPADPRLRAVDNAFLLGADLLVVCPVDAAADADAAVVMPRGDWREFDLADDAVTPGPSGDAWLPRLFIRGGAIIPLGPSVLYTGEAEGRRLTLITATDASGDARGALYQDAGEGFGYQRGELSRRVLECRGGELTASTRDEFDRVNLA